MPTHRSSHKITRQDLKHDSFTEWTAKATEFLQENYLRVGLGLLAVVIVIVGIQLYQRGQERATRRAAYLLYQGESLLVRGAFAAARQPLQEVRDRFDDTPFARQAGLDLAQAQAAMGERDAALGTIDQTLRGIADDDPVRHPLVMLKISLLGALKRTDEAVAAGRELLARADLPAHQRYNATLLLADTLREAGRTGEAVELLTALQREINAGKLQVQARDLESRIQLFKALAG